MSRYLYIISNYSSVSYALSCFPSLLLFSGNVSGISLKFPGFLASKSPFLWSWHLSCCQETIRLGHHWPVFSLLSLHLMLVNFHDCHSSFSDLLVRKILHSVFIFLFSLFLSSPHPPGALCQAKLAHLLCPLTMCGAWLFPGHSSAILECPVDFCWQDLQMKWIDTSTILTKRYLLSSMKVPPIQCKCAL